MTDPLAREYIRAQLGRHIDRWARGVTVCRCGGEYTNDAKGEGRRRHQKIFGHVPVEDEEAS